MVSKEREWGGFYISYIYYNIKIPIKSCRKSKFFIFSFFVFFSLLQFVFVAINYLEYSIIHGIFHRKRKRWRSPPSQCILWQPEYSFWYFLVISVTYISDFLCWSCYIHVFHHPHLPCCQHKFTESIFYIILLDSSYCISNYSQYQSRYHSCTLHQQAFFASCLSIF